MVKELIKAGADVNMQDDIGWTALMCAVENGNENIVRELIDRGADVNMQANDGNTALTGAVTLNRENVVKELVERGATINIKTDDGWTALIIAAVNGNENIVKELIDREAEVNMQDNNGDTALMIAVKWGDENMVKKLIEAGANIYLKNKAKDTALDIARKKGYRGDEIARMLENIDKKLYICKLAERGDLSELQNLCKEIKKNQKEKSNQYFKYENEVDSDGKTALMRALENRQDYLAVYQIMNGASLNCKDNYGKSVFEYMLENKNVGILNLCLKKEPDKNQIINILLAKANGNNRAALWALNMIDLKDSHNKNVINRFIKDGRIRNDAIKILKDNGLERENTKTNEKKKSGMGLPQI